MTLAEALERKRVRFRGCLGRQGNYGLTDDLSKAVGFLAWEINPDGSWGAAGWNVNKTYALGKYQP